MDYEKAIAEVRQDAEKLRKKIDHIRAHNWRSIEDERKISMYENLLLECNIKIRMFERRLNRDKD